jgi:hypothetical protein
MPYAQKLQFKLSWRFTYVAAAMKAKLTSTLQPSLLPQTLESVTLASTWLYSMSKS